MHSLCLAMRFRKSSCGGKVFVWHRKVENFRLFRLFAELVQKLRSSIYDRLGVVRKRFGYSCSNFRAWKLTLKSRFSMSTWQILRIFSGIIMKSIFLAVAQTMVAVRRKEFIHGKRKQALFEIQQRREGSTSPSRGEHWLTVYRAHTSCVTKMTRRALLL